MRRDEALRQLRQNRERLAALGVVHAYLFGSVARDTAAPESDIDVVVDAEGGEPLGLFRLARVADELERILERPIDVISKAGLVHTVGLQRRVTPDLVNAF